MSTRLLALLCLTASAAGCATAGVRRTAADVLLPPEEEVRLGEQVKAEILKEQKPLQNETVQRYVRDVGGRMLALAGQRIPEGLQPKFTVLDSPQVNAFAIPGGEIFVFTGLLAAVDSEAELASVLAHELAHVAHRDVAQQLVQQLGVQTVAGLVLGRDPGLLAQIAATVAANGYLLRYSRQAESNADRLGMELMIASPYQPRAMIAFFEALAKADQTPGALAFLRSHPAPGDRAEALERQLAASGRTGGELGGERLVEIQRMLPQPKAAGERPSQG